MRGSEFGDLVGFIAVAEERSFTRAAAKLGISQSALSYTGSIRGTHECEPPLHLHQALASATSAAMRVFTGLP